MHIIKKAVSLIDGNFFSAWSMTSSEQEVRSCEVFALEPVLLSALRCLLNAFRTAESHYLIVCF